MTKIVTMQEYEKERINFLKNNEVVNVITSPMIDNEYHKDYLCEKGQNMWEANSIMTVSREVEVGATKMMVQVKVIRHELWHTQDMNTYIAYEQF